MNISELLLLWKFNQKFNFMGKGMQATSNWIVILYQFWILLPDFC